MRIRPVLALALAGLALASNAPLIATGPAAPQYTKARAELLVEDRRVPDAGLEIDHSARIATIGWTAAARRADGMPASTATKNDIAAATE
jgi:hypothetical protein